MKLLHMDKTPVDFGIGRVVRVEFEIPPGFNTTMGMPAVTDHINVIRYIRKHAHGTWGYANPYVSSYKYISAFIFFKDDSDYLVFKLWCKFSVNTVYLWSNNMKFTVYEEVEEINDLSK